MSVCVCVCVCVWAVQCYCGSSWRLIICSRAGAFEGVNLKVKIFFFLFKIRIQQVRHYSRLFPVGGAIAPVSDFS